MKQAIRHQILLRRKRMQTDVWKEKSRQIFKTLIQSEDYQKNECIYCYLNTLNEAATEDILKHAWKQGKRTAVPRVIGDEMEFFYIESLTDLHSGYMGIREPSGKRIALEKGLVLVPGIAFDERCHRIGYGKGYYDRYFEKHPNHCRAGLGFELQIVPEIPDEKQDVPLDFIITEKRIILHGKAGC